MCGWNRAGTCAKCYSNDGRKWVGALAEKIQDAQKYNAVVVIGEQLVKRFQRRWTNAGRDCNLQLQQELVDRFVNSAVGVAQSEGYMRHRVKKQGKRHVARLFMQESATPISMFCCLSCETLSLRCFCLSLDAATT